MARPHLGISLDMYNNLFGPLNKCISFSLDLYDQQFPQKICTSSESSTGDVSETLLTQAHLGQHLPRPARVPEEGRWWELWGGKLKLKAGASICLLELMRRYMVCRWQVISGLVMLRCVFSRWVMLSMETVIWGKVFLQTPVPQKDQSRKRYSMIQYGTNIDFHIPDPPQHKQQEKAATSAFRFRPFNGHRGHPCNSTCQLIAHQAHPFFLVRKGYE